MAKSLLTIIEPLRGKLLPALYTELVALCPAEDDKRELQVLANRIREKLALELWEDYPDATLAAIYEAAQQITHEYPVSTECAFTLETITLDGTPEARAYIDADGNPMYAFSAVSGRIYSIADLKKELLRTQGDPLTRQPYSPYEMRRLGIDVADTAYEVQTTLVTFQPEDRVDSDDEEDELRSRQVYGCGIWVARVRLAVLLCVASAVSAALAGELGGNVPTRILSINTMFGFIIIAASANSYINHYHSTAIRQTSLEARTQYMNAARTAGLVGAAVFLLPIVLAAYAILGIEVVGAVKSFGLQSDISAEKVGGIAGAAYGVIFSLIALHAAWQLKHQHSYTSPAQTDTQRTAQRNLKFALHLIVFPLVVGAIGALVGTGTNREHGTFGGVCVGLLMAGLSLGRNHLPSAGWLVRRTPAPRPMNVPLLPLNNMQR